MTTADEQTDLYPPGFIFGNRGVYCSMCGGYTRVTMSLYGDPPPEGVTTDTFDLRQLVRMSIEPHDCDPSLKAERVARHHAYKRERDAALERFRS